MDTKLIVSASPHVRSEETTQSLMANVIVALCPCVVASAIIFGVRALLVTAVSVVACVAFEWLYCKLLKKPNPISDLSAVVTGIILAMNVPVGMPIGQLIIGDLVAALSLSRPMQATPPSWRFWTIGRMRSPRALRAWCISSTRSSSSSAAASAHSRSC